MKQLQELLDEKDLNDIFIVAGHPSWSFLQIKQQERYTTFEIKTLFLQEVFKRGILTLGSHNISFSHTKEDIDKLIDKQIAAVINFPKKQIGDLKSEVLVLGFPDENNEPILISTDKKLANGVQLY